MFQQRAATAAVLILFSLVTTAGAAPPEWS